MNKACGTLLKKKRQTHKRCTPVDPFKQTSKGWASETSGKRRSGKSMQVAHDDDEIFSSAEVIATVGLLKKFQILNVIIIK